MNLDDFMPLKSLLDIDVQSLKSNGSERSSFKEPLQVMTFLESFGAYFKAIRQLAYCDCTSYSSGAFLSPFPVSPILWLWT